MGNRFCATIGMTNANFTQFNERNSRKPASVGRAHRSRSNLMGQFQCGSANYKTEYKRMSLNSVARETVFGFFLSTSCIWAGLWELIPYEIVISCRFLVFWSLFRLVWFYSVICMILNAEFEFCCEWSRSNSF